MYYRDLIYVGVDNVLQRQMYASAANGRPRLISLLSGGLLGVSQVLPAENILQNAERFKFDVVEPSINRWSSYFAKRHISSTPTLRSMTLGMIDLRLALAHNPTSLKSPLPTLSFLAGKKDIALFPDNALEIFRRLNVSPFDVELKYLFKSFVEADANLYQTTMNGIQTYCRRNYTRVNGTQIPLPSITEEELTIIAASYLGILIAYVLPLPTTPVDNYQMYWATNILPQVFALVDQFNERSVIDTKQIENIAKFIYIMRYQVIHTPHKIAEELVEIQLTDPWSNLPPVMLGLNRELVHELADDIEDILEDSMEKEQNPFEDRAIGYIPFYTDYGQMDQEIIDCIEEDMDRLYELQEHYAYRALNENEILSLESLHARYYHLVKPAHNLSLEDMQSPKYRGVTVSTEAIPLVLMGALIVAIGSAIALAVKALLSVFGIGKQVKQELSIAEQTDQFINATMKSIQLQVNAVNDIGQNLSEVIDQALTNWSAENKARNKEYVRRIISTVRRYNPGSKLPKTDDVYDAGMLFIITELNGPEKITANMFTRKDNKHVPQVSTLFETKQGVDKLSKATQVIFEDTFKAVDALVAISSRTVTGRIIDELGKSDSSPTLDEFNKITNELSIAPESNNEQFVDMLSTTGAVNQQTVYRITVDHAAEISDIFISAADKGKLYQKHLANAKTELERALKEVEEAVKSGKLDDKKAKLINTAFNNRTSTARKVIINAARSLNTLAKQEFTIIQFLKQYKYLITNIGHAVVSLRTALGEEAGVEIVDE